MEASGGSNPICISTTAATYSSQSSSPITELSELQSDAHLAIHSIFTAKRSSDLEIQCTIKDFEVSLHQLEVETTADNVKATVTHLRRDLRTRVKCAKTIIKAKYDYHMTVQEARAERCADLEASEAMYSKAISKNAATQSLKSAMLCQEHTEHMRDLEMHALKAENKSCQHILVAHQAVLHQALPSFKENLHSSYTLLMGPSLSSHQSLTLTPVPQVEGQPLSTISLKPEPKGLLPQRGNIHPWMPKKTHQWTRISPQIHRRNCQNLRKGGQLTGSPP